jgi:hypothetical protein
MDPGKRGVDALRAWGNANDELLQIAVLTAKTASVDVPSLVA